MELEEQEKILKKVENVKELYGKSEKIDKSAQEKITEINHKLLDIISKELENNKVPSKEVLDTLHTAVILTATLPPVLF